MLEIKDLSLELNNKKILHAINLIIDSSSRYLITGDNGAGKSCLIMTICGQYKPSEGAVLYKGRNVEADNRKLLYREVGFIFQEPEYQLFMPIVWENVAFGISYEKNNKVNLRKEADAFLEMTGVKDLGDKPVSELSGGQKKRVAIASVLAQKPQIIIFDEPFSALDKKSKIKLAQLIKKLDIAYLIATHEFDQLEILDSTVIKIENGTLASYTPAHENKKYIQ